MVEDRNRKVRPLSENRPAKPFALSKDRSPRANDKDNAQPVIPPPRTAFIPHPRLAPPGMVGVRLAREAAQWTEDKRAERAAERPFKPFAHSRDKSREWER